jgi:hypothetical protein
MTAPASSVSPDPTTIQTSVNSEVHLKNLEHLSHIEGNPEEVALIEANPDKNESKLNSKNNKPNLYKRMAKMLKMSTRAFTVALIIICIIIISLILIEVFYAQIEMFTADNRTGIQGTLPAYTPSGYKLKRITYNTIGVNSSIVLLYKANSGNSNYQITEQYTTWDNQALINSVVSPDSNGIYYPFDTAGRTVYIYNSSAAWVGTNVYYKLSMNNSKLNANQITNIVSSS